MRVGACHTIDTTIRKIPESEYESFVKQEIALSLSTEILKFIEIEKNIEKYNERWFIEFEVLTRKQFSNLIKAIKRSGDETLINTVKEILEDV